jgi:very-short-patch-repair endonuclease
MPGARKKCLPHNTYLTRCLICKTANNIAKSREKFSDHNPKIWVECRICGLRSTSLIAHLHTRGGKLTHGITPEEYSKKHGQTHSEEYAKSLWEDREITPEQRTEMSERARGEKNPWYDHGGKLSPFSKRGKNYDPVAATRAFETKSRNGNVPTTLEYFLKKSGGDEEIAQKMLSERQRTFTLEKLIARHGPEEGARRFSDRQARWIRSYKKNNYSKVSQELFRAIMKHHSGDVYFAEWERPDMTGYKNKELRLTLTCGKSIMPDFVDVAQKKIIEFDGTYWHRDGRLNDSVNKSRSELRDEMCRADGWQVLHVREVDFAKNRQWVVAMCLSYLTGSPGSS